MNQIHIADEVMRLTEEVICLKGVNAELLDVAEDALSSMESFECDSRAQLPRLRAVISRAKAHEVAGRAG